MVTLIQIYKEKEKVGQKEIQNVHVWRKRASGKVVLESSPVLKEVKTDLMLNGMKGVVPSG